MSTLLILAMCLELISGPAEKGIRNIETIVAEQTAYVESASEYNVPKYSEEDLDLLARVLCSEAGCNWIPDWVQLYVGSVVLNRVNSELFPNSIYEVIYQRGQYAQAALYGRTPDTRTYENARFLLENGSQLPSGVLFQSTMTQGGGIYASYYDQWLGTTTYFCYR